VNKFSKPWNSHRISWNTSDLSAGEHERMALLQHVLQEHEI